MKNHEVVTANIAKPGAIVIGGHVQGLDIVRSLGEYSISVWVIDNDLCIASKSKYCSFFSRCPPYNSKNFIGFLEKLGDEYNLNNWSLLPTNDIIAHAISKNKETLGKIYKFTIPEFNIFKQFYYKKNTILLAQKNHIPVPETWFPESWNDFNKNFNFPIIIRGIEGLLFFKTFGKKLFIANNYSELIKAKERLQNVNYDLYNLMIQEKIPFNPLKRGYYFTSFCIEGEMKTFFLWEKLREHPLRHGTSTWCKSIIKEELIEPSKKLLKASRFTGVSEIEFLYDPRVKRYKIIEVNARTFLQSSLAKVCGVNYGKIIYDFLNELPIEYPSNYKKEIHWLHFWTDVVYGFIGFLKREYSFIDFVRPYFKKNKEMAVLKLDDPKPFLWETVLLPYIKRKRSGKNF